MREPEHRMSAEASTTSGEQMLAAGRLAAARERFWSEAEAAEVNGDSTAMAAAALGLGGIWVHEHRATLESARVTELQRRALGQLDPEAPIARRLRTRLAAEHAYRTGDASEILAELSSARQAGQPVLLAEALSLAHHCLLRPADAELRLALAEELIAVSPTTGRPLDGLMGLAWRTVDLFLAGDVRAQRSLTELRKRLETDRCDALSYLVAAIDVMLTTRAGRLVEAVRLAGRCYRLGLDVGDADAEGWCAAQLVAIRWLEGRSAELLPRVTALVSSPSIAEHRQGFFGAVAVLATAAGDPTAARAALACLRSGGLRNIPESSSWLATLLGVCEAAYALSDADAASEAYELLAPYAGLPVMASLGAACYGSAHRPLGLAALTTGRVDVAVAHLEAAVMADLSIANLPAHVMDLAALADALDRRGAPGDRHRADDVRRAAVAQARQLGMAARADDWERRRSGGGAATPVECRRNGRVWQLSLGERAVVVPHAVGMEYLARLVADAGVEIPAVELASGHALSSRGSSTQPVLDASAKAAYRRRIEELRDDVDDAEACGHVDRAARARDELDRLLAELARCSGFGGRTRAFMDGPERARVSVYKAIKRALATIAEADPLLGRELGSRVVTGTRCVYLPYEAAAGRRWQVS